MWTTWSLSLFDIPTLLLGSIQMASSSTFSCRFQQTKCFASTFTGLGWFSVGFKRLFSVKILLGWPTASSYTLFSGLLLQPSV